MKLLDKILEWLQNRNNRKYEKEGLTDDTLESQIRINELRNKHDIVDEKTVIKDNEGFVQ